MKPLRSLCIDSSFKVQFCFVPCSFHLFWKIAWEKKKKLWWEESGNYKRSTFIPNFCVYIDNLLR